VTTVIEVDGLSKRFGRFTAIDDVTFGVEENGIYGLLGRNGAGKTTMMQLLTGQDFASTGSIRVFGESPVENAAVLDRVCFIKESQRYPDDFRPKHVFASAPWFFPQWDADLAARLVDDFRVPLHRRIKKLSRGQVSAVGVIVGLASHAPLTFFDEPYLGLDAVARQTFYDRLLEDYAAHPRTIVLSTQPRAGDHSSSSLSSLISRSNCAGAPSITRRPVSRPSRRWRAILSIACSTWEPYSSGTTRYSPRYHQPPWAMIRKAAGSAVYRLSDSSAGRKRRSSASKIGFGLALT
jgi:ABC-type Na+ transport system ATPase subunit NatA